jgi:hypothetical protein
MEHKPLLQTLHLDSTVSSFADEVGNSVPGSLKFRSFLYPVSNNVFHHKGVVPDTLSHGIGTETSNKGELSNVGSGGGGESAAESRLDGGNSAGGEHRDNESIYWRGDVRGCCLREGLWLDTCVVGQK